MFLISPLGVFADSFDDYYNEITKAGKIYLNTIEPANDDEAEGLLTFAFNQFSNSEFEVWGMCRGDDPCTIQIVSKTDPESYKIFNVEVVYNFSNTSIVSKINGYKSKFGLGEKEVIIIDDLDMINFIYNGGYASNMSLDIMNNIVYYSSELKKLLGNSNIKVNLDTRMGWTHDFTDGMLGYMVLSYNNFAYGVIDPTGFTANKVLYIPESTANNRNAFITAAKLRLKNYLGVDIEITYGGTVAELEAEYYDEEYPDAPLWGIFDLDKIINVDNTLSEYYIFKIKDVEYKFFIEKNDDKMKDGALNTKDLATGSMIFTNSPNIPLDAQISYTVIDKNSKEYKDLIAKLNLTDGLMADINLFSNSKDVFITKLDNGKFKVYMPLSEEMQKQKLTAYYLKDDGTVEEYEVKIEDGYAIFETNHFSTYTLGADIDNPQTIDNITIYITLGIISFIGVAGCALFLNRKKRFN